MGGFAKGFGKGIIGVVARPVSSWHFITILALEQTMLKSPKSKKLGHFKTNSLIKISQHLLLSLAFESEQ